MVDHVVYHSSEIAITQGRPLPWSQVPEIIILISLLLAE